MNADNELQHEVTNLTVCRFHSIRPTDRRSAIHQVKTVRSEGNRECSVDRGSKHL
jgi:hypothetical protein